MVQDLKNRRDAVKAADSFNLPGAVPATSSRRPVCVVTFNSTWDNTGHPAPDPLLLAMRAANCWSWMVDLPLLASGLAAEDYIDDDMSVQDFLEEEAFCLAKFGHLKDPETANRSHVGRMICF